jgi:hypothetical protein
MRIGPVSLLELLNEIGGRNAIGRVDIVENRFVGIKSRGCYETPGGTLLIAAHRELEALCCERDVMHFKQHIALKYAELVYYGLWFTTLREALDAYVESTQKEVTGTVTLSLYKGNVAVVSRESTIRFTVQIYLPSPWAIVTIKRCSGVHSDSRPALPPRAIKTQEPNHGGFEDVAGKRGRAMKMWSPLPPAARSRFRELATLVWV